MAKFQFKLEPVLFQRRIEEERCQRDLAKSLRERMILHTQLRHMQQRVTQAKQSLTNGLVGVVDMTGVSSFARYSGQVRQRAHAFVMKLAGVEKQIDSARQTLIEASRRRKALELLRDKHYEAWKKRLAKREAAEMDEIAVQRYAYQHMMIGSE